MISQEIETTSRISLLLHKSEAGLRLSVSNKDILQVQVGFYSLFAKIMFTEIKENHSNSRIRSFRNKKVLLQFQGTLLTSKIISKIYSTECMYAQRTGVRNTV